MPSKAVAEAFQSRLGTTWNGIPVVGIDTIPEPPDDAEAFIVVQYPVVNASQPVLGRRFFEEGAARIVLNIKEGIGLAQGLEWADALAALFRVDDLALGLETFAPEAPVVDDTNDDGNWFSFAVIVPFRYQFDG